MSAPHPPWEGSEGPLPGTCSVLTTCYIRLSVVTTCYGVKLFFQALRRDSASVNTARIESTRGLNVCLVQW